MRKIFRRNSAPETPAPTEPTLESQLADLDAEERRWEGFIEGTTIETELILKGLRGVEARRAELLQPTDQATLE
jgi:hypothetical protein